MVKTKPIQEWMVKSGHFPKKTMPRSILSSCTPRDTKDDLHISRRKKMLLASRWGQLQPASQLHPYLIDESPKAKKCLQLASYPAPDGWGTLILPLSTFSCRSPSSTLSSCEPPTASPPAPPRRFLWRPRFLISIISANDQVKQRQTRWLWSNLGQPGSSPRKLGRQSLMTLLIKSRHPCGQTLVNPWSKPRSNPYVFELPPELLQRSPNFNQTLKNLPI
jgi:hypothetical protein